mmetsp:Transcript_9435/g.18967  ORF Transcript_9435/g.18967 Transcript_9435/m.18967 type:complete len:304 (+) Transcript_9435:332-1243(+)
MQTSNVEVFVRAIGIDQGVSNNNHGIICANFITLLPAVSTLPPFTKEWITVITVSNPIFPRINPFIVDNVVGRFIVECFTFNLVIIIPVHRYHLSTSKIPHIQLKHPFKARFTKVVQHHHTSSAHLVSLSNRNIRSGLVVCQSLFSIKSKLGLDRNTRTLTTAVATVASAFPTLNCSILAHVFHLCPLWRCLDFCRLHGQPHSGIMNVKLTIRRIFSNGKIASTATIINEIVNIRPFPRSQRSPNTSIARGTCQNFICVAARCLNGCHVGGAYPAVLLTNDDGENFSDKGLEGGGTGGGASTA